MLTASITTPDFVRYTWDNVRAGAALAGRDPETIDVGCTLVSSIGEDEESGRDGAREIAAMYLANKVQNIQGAAEVLLQKANLEPDEIRPVAEDCRRSRRASHQRRRNAGADGVRRATCTESSARTERTSTSVIVVKRPSTPIARPTRPPLHAIVVRSVCAPSA